MEQYGDAKLTDLLQTLAECPKARSASIHDRCKAVYGQSAVIGVLARISRRTAG
jgi:hypothetical protein